MRHSRGENNVSLTFYLLNIDGETIFLGRCTNSGARPGWFFLCDKDGLNVVAMPDRPTIQEIEEKGLDASKYRGSQTHNNLWIV